METFQAIFALIFAPTSVIAVVAWLLTKYFEKTLSRDLESHKARLNSDLELSKAQLAHEFQMKSFEHQTRFSFFYQKQAEIISELYALLFHAVSSIESLVKPLQFAGEKSNEEKIKEAVDSYNELLKHFNVNRVYLNEDICEKMDVILKTMRVSFINYSIASSPMSYSSNNLDRWVEAWEALQKELPPIRQELESQFRQILSIGLPIAPAQPSPTAALDA